jgi:hypothetical protein
MQASSQISVRRLNWAGVEIVRDQQRILIDPMENAEPFEHLLGKPRHPLEPVIGRHVFTVAVQSCLAGGHVRVGMEDGIYLSRGVLAPSDAAMVTKIREIAEALGASIATSAEARDMLGLQQRSN